jgi:hypothetical protein
MNAEGRAWKARSKNRDRTLSRRAAPRDVSRRNQFWRILSRILAQVVANLLNNAALR